MLPAIYSFINGHELKYLGFQFHVQPCSVKKTIISTNKGTKCKISQTLKLLQHLQFNKCSVAPLGNTRDNYKLVPSDCLHETQNSL